MHAQLFFDFSGERFIIILFIFQNMLSGYSVRFIFEISACKFFCVSADLSTLSFCSAPRHSGARCVCHFLLLRCLRFKRSARSSCLWEETKGFSSLIDDECESSVSVLRYWHKFLSIVEILCRISNMPSYYSIIILEIFLRFEIHMMLSELVLHGTIPVAV